MKTNHFYKGFTFILLMIEKVLIICKIFKLKTIVDRNRLRHLTFFENNRFIYDLRSVIQNQYTESSINIVIDYK